MSWSASLPNPVLKKEVDAALDAIPINLEGPMLDQLRTAKAAVRAILPNIPGPYIMVSMSGHANGVGWQKKEGWANDCITVNISQVTEAPTSAGHPNG